MAERQKKLEIINIHKSFEKGTINENYVLKGVELTLYEGDFVTVIGGNGAGKSTMMNTIAGNYIPDEGNIRINHEDVTYMPTNKRASLIGYVFQDTRMGTASRLSIEENMALANQRGRTRGLRKGVRDEDRAMMKERLEVLGLGLENRLTTEVQFLSGGQRQALTLLMATLQTPQVLLLDEHTAALDPSTSEMVLSLTDKLVREENLTAMMITHNMSDALKYGNRLVMLHQGRIILDVAGEEKENLTITDLMQLFKQRSGEELTNDAMLLG
ncbi:ABC transporter ATP-binding protein [Suicoccus acidiformans]|uniref:ABC transporter ATP-binding protein n=1 Tax=Suicoccus acidiformans TaxID=2036206 RepID=A0A347WNE8_9LACT|nr:ATP-binding cassette domain-containing protein [Suicoccus acidiformans]AXY26605.1 ABC transporter ATP-binding protein [Suicoccus acidiformans]